MNITFIKDDESVTLNEFLYFLNWCLPDLRGYSRSALKYSAEPGKKYIRIVETWGTEHPSRSVYCFLDMNGNIYKSATWKAPAKHVRGSVFDKDFSYGQGLNLYGARHLK